MEVDVLLLPTIMEEEEIGEGQRIARAGGGAVCRRLAGGGHQRGSWKQRPREQGSTDLLLKDTSEPTVKAHIDTRHQAHRRMNYRL
jgi:hypothetical protein